MFLLANEGQRIIIANNIGKIVHLANKYPSSCWDFFSSSTPCTYKSGLSWYVPEDPEAQGIDCEACPVHCHLIMPTWLLMGQCIYNGLNSIAVE
ncbi:unnamed protein product [Tuber aestivum]|uniref:Uncharacterized protein n=1 Tax=Tuber aestivum TaxID=59557 RepID=A0A292PWV6_9PEZI|nr:unnamed protein product [Tuber aestivum]